MTNYLIQKPLNPINAEITLDGSKSISNRVQIIKALCKGDFKITGLSTSDDSECMKKLLSDLSQDTYDSHHAGTTYRFMTAYLALQEGEQILTGSSRMKERPIGPLVDALRSLGAQIEYIEEEGYPPLKIASPNWIANNEVVINAGISSQYLSALLLVAPVLPNGLKLTMEGDMVSKPYLQMTLNIMNYFGISYEWVGQTIAIDHQAYQPKGFSVEADWSAASYYYSIVAMAPDATITLNGLQLDSLQGDSQVRKIYESLGVHSEFSADNKLILTNSGNAKSLLDYDFIEQPDLAQTVCVSVAGLGNQGLYTGLQTLMIKETDRVAALKTELAKLGVSLIKMPPKFSPKTGLQYYMQEGAVNSESIPVFATYKDHRMAMAFAPLALLLDIEIENPNVVSKSYTNFWEDLKKLGFRISTDF